MTRERPHLDRVRDALEQAAREHERLAEEMSAAAEAAIAAARQLHQQIDAQRAAGHA